MDNLRPALSQDELENAFSSIGEGAIILDAKGRVIRANKVALDLLGYLEPELVGSRFLDKVEALNIDHKKFDLFDRPTAKAITTGRPVYEYLYYKGKRSGLIPVFVSVAPIIKGSKPVGLTIIFRDISVEEAVDQMKSEFISLASHQLRTPLASIKTYSHMLLDGYMGQIDDEKRPALETIVSATNRMNELISTLLNISRLESGAILVEISKIDLSLIVTEIINELEIQAKARSINLRMRLKGSPVIYSDAPIIKEVLANLISNSVKYSKDNGNVTISISSSQNFVTISIKDNGLGIPDPAKAQIFSKFFRANNVIQIETSGTGLGLYLVKGLVSELGGKITFTSKENVGTTFRLKLPTKLNSKK
ncbi:MAG: sensor histidine kinase [Candidatus Saccharimonadales bacterium]